MISIETIREDAKIELIEILESLRGPKCLILDVQIGNILKNILPDGLKILKDSGVQYFKDLKSDLGDFRSDSSRDTPDHIIYLSRPSISHMKIISSQIQHLIKLGLRSQYHIYFVPLRSVACEQILEDEGVLNLLSIGEYHLELVPLDSDLLSLELSDVYRQCYLEGDSSSLNIIAQSLQKFQYRFGEFPEIKSKGVASKKVLQKLLQQSKENSSKTSTENSNSTCQLSSLLILDREIDLYSVFLTPLTYEGLIDEVLHIENGRVKLDPSLIEEKDQKNLEIASESKSIPGEKISFLLNDTDPIFAEIRNLSIEALGLYLQEKALTVRKLYSDFRDNKDASIAEIHEFVKKIPQLTKEYKSLDQHIHIAELLKKTTDSPEFRELWQTERGILEGESLIDTVEELILSDSDRENLFRCLRLLCLLSLINGGIRSSKYDQIRRLLVQSYGYPLMFTLSNLERIGLLKRKETLLLESSTNISPVWTTLRKNLRLINEGVNVARPNDISYVTAGYAPLLVRLIEAAGSSRGWKNLSETMKLLPGPLVEYSKSNQQTEESQDLIRTKNEPGDIREDFNPYDNQLSMSINSTPSKTVLMVFVIGGITFLEIAALRYLSNNPTFPYKILIASTSLTNGNMFLQSLEQNISC